jgi:hypothetical protein
VRPALPACWHARLIDQKSLEGCKPTRKHHSRVLCRCYWRWPNPSLSTCSVAKRSSRAARPHRLTHGIPRPHRGTTPARQAPDNMAHSPPTLACTPATTAANHLTSSTPALTTLRIARPPARFHQGVPSWPFGTASS